MLRGLSVTCSDIIRGWSCIDYLYIYTEKYHGADDGGGKRTEGARSLRHVAVNAEWYLFLSWQQSFSYKCVQSSSEIEVDDIFPLLVVVVN